MFAHCPDAKASIASCSYAQSTFIHIPDQEKQNITIERRVTGVIFLLKQIVIFLYKLGTFANQVSDNYESLENNEKWQEKKKKRPRLSSLN